MPEPTFITIVSGLPRSGTSMMMQMLAAGGMPLLTDETRPPDANNPRGYFEYEPVKRTRDDCSWVRRAPGLAVKVIYALLRHLPAGQEFRVILMRRETEEVLSSQIAMLQRSGALGSALAPDRMAEAFARDLAGVLSELARRPEFRLLEVTYGDCLSAPATVAAQLNGFLGGHLSEEQMAKVPDRTLCHYQEKRS